jgi:ABC-2 type transport system permease protein
MGPRLYSLIAGLCLVVGLICINALANLGLAGVRFDATENKLYSLSSGSLAVMAQQKEPVTLTLFFTPEATGDAPEIRHYGARVRELVRSYAAKSNGNITFAEVNPTPSSPAEVEARANGLQSFQVTAAGDPIFLGLVATNSIDESQSIAFVAPVREASLEYEITAALARLANAQKPRLAVITSLPWFFGPNGDGANGVSIASALVENYDTTVLSADFSDIPRSTDVLLVAQPPTLSPQQLYAIDQFVMRKGRLLLLIDPAALSATQLGGDTQFKDQLGSLSASWGLNLSDDVVIDRANGLAVSIEGSGQKSIAVQPLYFTVPATGLSKSDLVTASLVRGINVGAPGAFTTQMRNGVEVEPLLRASPSAGHISATIALSRPSPKSIVSKVSSNAKSDMIALRLSGQFKSAFPAGLPAAAGANEAGNKPARDHAGQSVSEAQIIAVADVDFLADSFYRTGQDQPPLADNALFILNAIDNLAGSDALVSLRSRAPSARPLIAIERIKATATARSAETEESLRAELEATQRRLAALEDKNADVGSFTPQTGQASAEINRFQARAAELRAELQAVGQSYRREIEAIKTRIIMLCAGVVPALVLLTGLVLSVRRKRLSRVR